MNNEPRENHRHQNSAGIARNTPVPWDPQSGQERPSSRGSNHRRDSKDSAPYRDRDRDRDRERERDPKEVQRERVERYGSRQPHTRNESNAATGGSQGEFGDPQHAVRRHDYDVQSMETALSSPRASITKNPIPAPTVTVKSEFPTLSRSRVQQSLTCLVTIEVPEGKWRPDPADLRGAPVLPPIQQDSNMYSAQPRSPAQAQQQQDWQFESSEMLEEITEDLRTRVDNWHGLDFSR